MTKLLAYLPAFLLLASAALSAEAVFELPALFSDNMVIQAGPRAPVWGKTRPNTRVIVRLVRDRDSKTLTYSSAMSDDAGSFKILLSALSPNVTPCTLTLETLRGESHVIRNVIVGEVWLCAGEANMQWSLAASENGAAESAAANYPLLRFFTVPDAVSAPGAPGFPEGAWVVCTPQTSATFSAVGFHFGKELQKSFKRPTPVGMICAATSIAPLRTWLSADALTQSNLLHEVMGEAVVENEELTIKNEELRSQKSEVESIDDFPDIPVMPESVQWALPSTPDADWPMMALPTPLGWDTAPGMEDFKKGVVWFRKTVDIPVDWIGKALTLQLGVIRETDIAYFNGQQVGATGIEASDDRQAQRRYTIPARLVKTSGGLLAMRVSDTRGGGGVLTGPLRLAPADHSDAPLSLMGPWKYHVEHGWRGPPHSPPLLERITDTPASIFELMVRPIIPYAISGILWYQGESDTGNAESYRKLFPAVVNDWRMLWRNPHLPFYWAQLPSFGQRRPDAEDTEWARFREVQAAALGIRDTGQAVLIDAGTVEDIHPRDKATVGKRFALLARANIYGQKVTSSGPTFRKVRLKDKRLVVTFRDCDNGLELRGDVARSFAVAGADGVYYWADTVEVDGRSVVVGSSRVTRPVAVRYAWGNNPAAPLYNAEGLPASPFAAEL